MTKKSFINIIKTNGFRGELFNSNNGWGFGGAFGYKYSKGDCLVKIARSNCRHGEFDTDFITITIPEYGRMFDAEQTPKNFDSALKTLQKQKLLQSEK